VNNENSHPFARVNPTWLHLATKTAVPIAYVASMFMSATDNHIVTVILPTLRREYQSELAAVNGR
jgi:hypothetical protein